jgi:hypothetical protein
MNFAAIVGVLTATSAFAQEHAGTATATAQAGAADHAAGAHGTAKYSTSETEIGTLLDDPAAKAIVAKHIPGLVDNDQIEMARAMTLETVQQYAPDEVTDERLAAIDADLAKLK